ncbi:hypothetical protein AB0M02_17235 [Actinoplanes sp. NPDC051861]|uniref:fascin domain-containing protein n=1 Tax=Actinoplanes sp. NPDC051861 TaxID=3155170 RepID=UPI00343DAFE8
MKLRRRFLTAAAALGMAITGAVVPATSALADDVSRVGGCDIHIRAMWTQKWWVAWANQPNAPVTANSMNYQGQWEKFYLQTLPDGTFRIVSKATNRYIVARADVNQSPLAANSGVAGNWERFVLEDLQTDWQGYDGYLRAVSNFKYVLTRADEPNSPARANSNIKGIWERVRLEPLDYESDSCWPKGDNPYR